VHTIYCNYLIHHLCCPSANRQVSNEMQTNCGTLCYTTEDDVFRDNEVGNALQDLANPAARLRILVCEHQTIQAEHKEREFLVAECGCHLRDRHHAHAMTLHTHGTLISCLLLLLTNSQDQSNLITGCTTDTHRRISGVHQVVPVCTPRNAHFLGPTRVHNLNGIWIGSAILAELMAEFVEHARACSFL